MAGRVLQREVLSGFSLFVEHTAFAGICRRTCERRRFRRAIFCSIFRAPKLIPEIIIGVSSRIGFFERFPIVVLG